LLLGGGLQETNVSGKGGEARGQPAGGKKQNRKTSSTLKSWLGGNVQPRELKHQNKEHLGEKRIGGKTGGARKDCGSRGFGRRPNKGNVAGSS